MSALAPIDLATAAGEAAELLAQVQNALGVTPNMTKAMANSPALLKGYLAPHVEALLSLPDAIARNHGDVRPVVKLARTAV